MKAPTKAKPLRSCSFCGRTEAEVERLIIAKSPPARSPPPAICKDCLGTVNEIKASMGTTGEGQSA